MRVIKAPRPDALVIFRLDPADAHDVPSLEMLGSV